MKRKRGLTRLIPLPLSVLTGCSVLLDPVVGQCRRHEDCQALGVGYVCAPDAVCVELVDSFPGSVGRDAGSCQLDADCASTHGLALCREGACLTLNAPEVGCLSSGWGTTVPEDGSSVLPIGMLVPDAELSSSGTGRRVSGAVGTAINELNRARERDSLAGLPALVGVACDEARPEALAYLVDSLQLGVILGPSRSDAVRQALARTAGRALLVAPFADAPSLLPEAADPAAYLLSCKPNRQHLRAYMLAAVDEARALVGALGAPGLDPSSLALAVSNDVATQRFAEGFNDRDLAAAGLRRVRYAMGAGGLGLVNALRGVTPPVNLVVAASAEDAWAENIAAYDGATFASHGYYPYYLLAERRWDLYNEVLRDQATADGFAPQYARLLGLDYHREPESALVYDEFRSAFFAETGSQAEPNLEYAYDCTYLAVYATVAAAQRSSQPANRLSAEAIAAGLGALHGGGPLLPVRELDVARVIAGLVERKGEDAAVDLVGASGRLDLERLLPSDGAGLVARQYWSADAADGELYCIDTDQKVFCDTGIVFSRDGGSVVRGENPCRCLGSD